MTVTERIVDTAESVKEAVVGLSHGSTTRRTSSNQSPRASAPAPPPPSPSFSSSSTTTPFSLLAWSEQTTVERMLRSSATTEATRQEMSDARLPLAYRDSCAHLLIPLNKCRYDNYYLNWRCQVCQEIVLVGGEAEEKLTRGPGREAFVRKVPIRGVQATCEEDGRD